ncbi:hypothetical protein [Streptomyces sp. YIM 121038]|uniref:hypothetical protein n=1 Tax=Streptomyces sp. YIM 121038 TaxID=2136401 RepID=UPI00111074ED|nr:hypothetical protein [Streptomyces sp. YIM 121038]
MLQNRTIRRRFGAGVATLVAAAMIGTVTSASAAAADRTHVQVEAAPAVASADAIQILRNAVVHIAERESAADTGSAAVRSDSLADISDEKGIAALEQAFDIIGSIPESLIQRIETGDQGAVQEVVDFLNSKPATRGWFSCVTGVAKFAAENGIGIAKVYKITKGGKKVIKAVWDYIKHKKRPTGIDEDIVNLIVNSTGLPALAEACL